MTAFTEIEQWESDLDWYAIDRDGRIGQFSTAGHRILPKIYASDKETKEKLSNYFESLSFKSDNFIICPNFKKNYRGNEDVLRSTDSGLRLLDENTRMKEIDDYITRSNESNNFAIRMASRGLFSYDSNSYTHPNTPYFRFAIPKDELKLEDVPQDIKNLLEKFKINTVSFLEDSLISGQITDKL